MIYPERFSNLADYAFPRLRALLDVHEPGGEPLALTIGEPQHAFPSWVGDVLADNIAGFAKYPPNDGEPDLLAATFLGVCGANIPASGEFPGLKTAPPATARCGSGMNPCSYQEGQPRVRNSKISARPQPLISP